MKTSKGLFTDTAPVDTPPGYLIFGKNLLLTEKLGVIQNEKGFTLSTLIPNRTVVGALAIQDDLVLWSVGTEGVALPPSYVQVIDNADCTSWNVDPADPGPANAYPNIPSDTSPWGSGGAGAVTLGRTRVSRTDPGLGYYNRFYSTSLYKNVSLNTTDTYRITYQAEITDVSMIYTFYSQVQYTFYDVLGNVVTQRTFNNTVNGSWSINQTETLTFSVPIAKIDIRGLLSPSAGDTGIMRINAQVFNIETVVPNIGSQIISEVGIVRNNIYSKVINDNDLLPVGKKFNFSESTPIKAESYINYEGHKIVAWIDDVNTPKILDLDDPSFQYNDLELFPSADLSMPQVEVLQSSGSLLTGTYKILYSYEDDDGSISGWSSTSKVVNIIQDAPTAAVDTANMSQVSGSAPGVTTAKAIRITIASPDVNWKYIRLAVMKTINSITTVEQFTRRPVGATSYVYTGGESAITLTLAEVLTPVAKYLSAKAITQLNNKLYLANLTAEEEANLTKVAMRASLRWVSRKTDTLEGGSNSAYKEASGTKYAGFAHGEVYAMYMQFRDKSTGLWTRGFHIPGVVYDAATWAANTWDSVIAPTPTGTYRSGTGSPTFKKYQLEDAGVTWTTTSGLLNGTMGVWKNDNETYPDLPEFDLTTDYAGNPIPGGIDYRNKPVTHHKFPTIKLLREAYGDTAYGVTKLDVLGLKVSNVVFDSERFNAWRICYAKRDLDNATVIGTSGLFFMGQGVVTRQFKPTAVNGSVWQSQVLGLIQDGIMQLAGVSGGSVAPGFDAAAGSEFIRWHGFNTQVDLQAVAPNYIRQELILNCNNNSTSSSTGDPRVIVDTANDLAAIRKWSLYNQNVYTTSSIPSTAWRFRNVQFIQYLPTGGIINVSGNTINNQVGESCMLLRNNITGFGTTSTDGINKFLGVQTNVPTTPIAASNEFSINGFPHKNGLSSLCVIRSDVYNSFYTQELVSTDQEFQTATTTHVTESVITSPVQGGDNFVGQHSIYLQGPATDNNITNASPPEAGATQGQGCKGVHVIWSECGKNVNYRYADPGNTQSTFYGDTPLPKLQFSGSWQTSPLGLMDLQLSPVYLYNSDYSVLNDTGINMEAFNPFDITATTFPTTIVSSLPASAESNNNLWRTFLASDRYTMPRNKGVVTNLQGQGNQRLYIHMTNGLFLTKDRISLKTSTADVTLGSGDIFDVTPYEIVSTNEGYAGTQHKFGCVLTKAGYVFADASQGKLFIHTGESLNEISKAGLRQFWRDNFPATLTDNPFTTDGVTVAYDEQYNRILVTLRLGSGKFITASYSPQLEAWCSFHDYNPNYMIAARANKLYSLLNKNGNAYIYTHNTGVYGRYYQETNDLTVFPMIADVVYNFDPYTAKLFKSINWISQTITAGNEVVNDETIDYITVRSANKTTDRVEIEKYVNAAEVHDANTRLTESTWSFNKLRDVSVKSNNKSLVLDFFNNYNVNPVAVGDSDWYEQGRFIDTYLVARFEYSNLNNNKFLLLDHNADYRKSIRS